MQAKRGGLVVGMGVVVGLGRSFEACNPAQIARIWNKKQTVYDCLMRLGCLAAGREHESWQKHQNTMATITTFGASFDIWRIGISLLIYTTLY